MPDEWTLLKEEPGSFNQPHLATFSKPGTAAFFVLVREHLEGTPKLYKELLERGLSQNAALERDGEESVTRDGLAGTHWNVTWKEDGGLVYFGVMEFFTVGDDHYRMTAAAPKEVYDRYAATFENMLRSVQFPMLHADPRVLEGIK